MKTATKKALIILSAFFLLAFIAPRKNIRILMCGDSTMTIQPLSKSVYDSIMAIWIDEPFPVRGWGQMLPAFFNSNVIIQNYAKSGKSSKSFINDGLWSKMLSNLWEDDYVVIEFGINDISTNPDRHSTPQEFETNIKKFLVDVKKKGAIPILCTPMSSRKFVNGSLANDYKVYSDIVRKIAVEESVLFIDMEKKGREIILKYGEKESEKLFVNLKPGVNRNFPKGVNDVTHFNELGATLMAKEFIKGLHELKINDLTQNLK